MPAESTVPVGAILLVEIDRSDGTALSEQIYSAIRRAIEDGRLHAAAPLPSSRALARDLGVARSTVTLAYDHLRREGYIEGSVGRANRVVGRAPQPPHRQPVRQPAAGRTLHPLARRARILNDATIPLLELLWKRPRPFRPGIPALDIFPLDTWHRLLSRAWRRGSPESMSYGDLLGYAPLRRAIAEHLRSARGLTCSPDQVVICNGSQQALDLSIRLVMDPGDRAWIEDPGYLGTRLAIEAHGGRIVPVPVDDEGLDVGAGIAAAPDARLACVTPARQFPLGHAMSRPRREALLAWAHSAGSWIFEDDYDSDVRYASAPLRPLQALDDTGCVILAGSFSKVVLPSLRLGYMVVPPSLCETVRRLRFATDCGSPVLLQAVMADFITGGHFARHIRRVRAAYQQRHDLLVERLRETLGEGYEVRPIGAGSSLILWLPDDVDADEVVRRAGAYDLELWNLSPTAVRRRLRPGLLLGFGGLGDADLREGADRLARLLSAAVPA